MQKRREANSQIRARQPREALRGHEEGEQGAFAPGRAELGEEDDEGQDLELRDGFDEGGGPEDEVGVRDADSQVETVDEDDVGEHAEGEEDLGASEELA